jgi:hypothetical protein
LSNGGQVPSGQIQPAFSGGQQAEACATNHYRVNLERFISPPPLAMTLCYHARTEEGSNFSLFGR